MVGKNCIAPKKPSCSTIRWIVVPPISILVGKVDLRRLATAGCHIGMLQPRRQSASPVFASSTSIRAPAHRRDRRAPALSRSAARPAIRGAGLAQPAYHLAARDRPTPATDPRTAHRASAAAVVVAPGLAPQPGYAARPADNAAARSWRLAAISGKSASASSTRETRSPRGRS